MRFSVCIGPGRDDADALALQHRKRHVAEVQNDMPHVVVSLGIGEAEIAGDSRDRGAAAIIKIDRRLAGGRRRHAFAAATGMRLGNEAGGFVILGPATFAVGARNVVLRRQFLPAELLVD